MEDTRPSYTVKNDVSCIPNRQNHAPVSQKRFSSTQGLPSLEPVSQNCFLSYWRATSSGVPGGSSQNSLHLEGRRAAESLFSCFWKHFWRLDGDFGIPGGIANLSTPRVITVLLPAGGPKPTGPHVFYGTKSRDVKFGFVLNFDLAAGG